MDPGLRHPGQLVDPTGPQTWTGAAQDRWSTPGALGPIAIRLVPLFNTVAPRARSRIARDAGQNGGHSRTGLSRLEWLVDPWASDQVTSLLGLLVDTAVTRNLARFTRDSWPTPRAIGQEPNSHGTAGSTCGTSDPGKSHPGQLVHPAGTRTYARANWDIWSTPDSLCLQEGSRPSPWRRPLLSRGRKDALEKV